MGKIILLAILVLIALAIFIWRPGLYKTESVINAQGYREKQNRRIGLTKIGFIPLGLAVIMLLFTSFTQVHAKEIGVGVSFGKPVSEYSAGLHLKPFWQSVTKIDGTVFIDSYGTDTPGSAKALAVRLGDGNPAQASTTIRWRVNPEAIDYIYSTYRSDDPAGKLHDAVVETQYKSVVNEAFSTFNPTANVASTTADPNALNFSPNYAELATQITDRMTEAVKDSEGISLIIIDKVTVSGVNYSADTEKRISGIVQQASKTQQAKQLQATNEALATANGKLINSLSGENGVKLLVQQCLQGLEDKKFTAPPGFSCWPGSGSSVVIPSAK